LADARCLGILPIHAIGRASGVRGSKTPVAEIFGEKSLKIGANWPLAEIPALVVL
jgi:hypothetical protein